MPFRFCTKKIKIASASKLKKPIKCTDLMAYVWRGTKIGWRRIGQFSNVAILLGFKIG
jgi:hypothetical protein